MDQKTQTVYYCSMCNLAQLTVTIHHVTIPFSLRPANEMFYIAVFLMPNYRHSIYHKANILTQSIPRWSSTYKNTTDEF